MIVIGDVHGEFDALMRLLDILPQTKELCFVGDLIDRGPNSKEVIEFVRKNNYQTVMGNHEDLITDFNLWLNPRNGGQETLKSFGGREAFLKTDVIEWISSLPILIQYGNYIISHSFAYNGLDTYNEDLLWGRKFKLGSIKNTDFISVFGHTPVESAQKKCNKHWLIDTGATFGNKLSAIDLTDEQIYFVDNAKP